MSDIRIHENGDGGDIIITESGDLKQELTLFSAVYLSVFEGKTFYSVYDNLGNNISDDDIENLLNQAVNISNFGQIESVIDNKLQWLINDEICSAVQTSVKSGDKTDSLLIEILITEPSGENKIFNLLWNQQKKELIYYKEIQ